MLKHPTLDNVSNYLVLVPEALAGFAFTNLVRLLAELTHLFMLMTVTSLNQKNSKRQQFRQNDVENKVEDTKRQCDYFRRTDYPSSSMPIALADVLINSDDRTPLSFRPLTT